MLVMLRKTDEFSSVFSFRKRISGTFLTIYYFPTQNATCRFGFVVAKKVAKLALERNYMRRVLRELCRSEMRKAVLPSSDLVIQVNKKFGRQDFGVVNQEFSTLLNKISKKLSLQITQQVNDA